MYVLLSVCRCMCFGVYVFECECGEPVFETVYPSVGPYIRLF